MAAAGAEQQTGQRNNSTSRISRTAGLARLVTNNTVVEPRTIHATAPCRRVRAEGEFEPRNARHSAYPCREDERNLCDLLRRILERAGFATAGVTNGREALHHVRAEPFDLIITDMVMPEMDGVELMRVLHEEGPILPIIAISGAEDMMEYQRIAAHLGAKVTLRKPIAPADLVGAVRAALIPEFSSKANNAEIARSA
jgi:CheY-like chemotaxis protein